MTALNCTHFQARTITAPDVLQHRMVDMFTGCTETDIRYNFGMFYQEQSKYPGSYCTNFCKYVLHLSQELVVE